MVPAAEAERLQAALCQSERRERKLIKKLREYRTERRHERLKRRAGAGLPLNRRLMALNVQDGPVPLGVLAEARRLYEAHVAPHLDPGRAETQTRWTADGLSFYAVSPSEKNWGYHIDWVYPNCLASRAEFQRLFDGLSLDEWFGQGEEGVRVDGQVVMHGASFVVRTGAGESPFFHTDYEWWHCSQGVWRLVEADPSDAGKHGGAASAPPGMQAYTLMAPLQPMDQFADGHLMYKDIWGTEQVYRYEHGKAVCFGSGFEHATQPSVSTERKVFLQISLGTDKFAEYWQQFLSPPNGPPLGSPEFMPEVYKLLGIDPGCSTGYTAAGELVESSESDSEDSSSLSSDDIVDSD